MTTQSRLAGLAALALLATARPAVAQPGRAFPPQPQPARTAPLPFPTPTPLQPIVAGGVMFYDAEMRAGRNPLSHLLKANTVFHLDNGTTFEWAEHWYIEGRDPAQFPVGTGFVWETRSDLFGCAAGVWGVHTGYQSYMGAVFPFTQLAVNGTEAGLKMQVQPADGEDTMYMRIHAYVCRGKSRASLELPIETVEDIHTRRTVITAEYLEGNALENIKFETKEFAGAPLVSGTFRISARWRPHLDPPSYYEAPFAQTVPSGPLRMTLEIEGFKPDSVQINAAGDSLYTWYALLEPDSDSDNPPLLFDPQLFHNAPDSISTPTLLLLPWTEMLTGYCHCAFEHPFYRFDLNEDDLFDASDLVMRNYLAEEHTR